MPDNLNEQIPIFVYFHGGGLECGDKEACPFQNFTEKNVGFISVNYRMYPNNRYPDFIWDCAAALRWIFDNINKYTEVSKMYVGGSSAGAYIAMMLCFDKRYFSTYGIDIKNISGFVFDAGQTTTHFNVLRERGVDSRKCIIDEAAPIYHIEEYDNQPPMLIFCSDNDMMNRYEQTLLLLGTLKHMNYPDSNVKFIYFKGHNHCDYIDNKEVFAANIIDFIKKEK